MGDCQSPHEGLWVQMGRRDAQAAVGLWASGDPHRSDREAAKVDFADQKLLFYYPGS